MGNYDVAQICLNGHVITSRIKRSPELGQKFCGECGDPTITECQNCKSEIRGYYYADSAVISPYIAPHYCHECGKPYPWTERKLLAAWELADELDELTDTDKEKLKSSLEDVTRDSPKTEVATTRLKKILSKLGQESSSILKSILIEIATEAAKKTLFGK